MHWGQSPCGRELGGMENGICRHRIITSINSPTCRVPLEGNIETLFFSRGSCGTYFTYLIHFPGCRNLDCLEIGICRPWTMILATFIQYSCTTRWHRDSCQNKGCNICSTSLCNFYVSHTLSCMEVWICHQSKADVSHCVVHPAVIIEPYFPLNHTLQHLYYRFKSLSFW